MGDVVSEAVETRMRTALKSALANGRTMAGISAQSSVSVSRLSAFHRGGPLGIGTAQRLARALGIPSGEDARATSEDALWDAAAQWQPDRVLVDVSAAGSVVSAVRRNEVVRRFAGKSVAAVLQEMRRCATT